MVQRRDDVVGIDSSVILPKQVWEASGHVEVFSDPLVECLQCHRRYREDHLIEAFEEKKGRAPEGGLAEIVCANCGTDIAPARLNALPMATLCIDCAP